MKIKIIPSIIAIAISALVSYGIYSISRNSLDNTLLATGCGVMSLFTLVTALGIQFKQPRATANIKIVSLIFFVIALVSNLIFAFWVPSQPAYIIVNGLLLLVWLLVVYGLSKAKQ